MNAVVLALAILSFLVCLKLTRVVPRVEEAAAEARQAVAVLGAPDLDDQRKEAAARSASLAMIGAFFTILLRSGIAFGLPLLLVAACVSLGLVSLEGIEAAATNIYVLIGTTLAVILAWRLLR